MLIRHSRIIHVQISLRAWLSSGSKCESPPRSLSQFQPLSVVATIFCCFFSLPINSKHFRLFFISFDSTMKVFILLALATLASGQWDPHWTTGRSAMVHLFEWKWSDIARECEDYLAPNGFGGVQISPPTENTAIVLDWLSTKRPWW
jgi:hypothetical protein